MSGLTKAWHYWKYPCFIFLIFYLFFVGLSSAFYPLLVGFFFSYLVFPLVIKLENKHVPRWMISSGILLVFVFFISALLFFLVPLLVGELTLFVSALPKILAKVITFLNVALKESSIDYQINMDSLLKEGHIKKLVQHLSETSRGTLSSFVNITYTNFAKLLIGLFSVCLLPVFFFYCVDRYESIKRELWRYVPPRFKEEVTQFINNVQLSFGSFFRGQLIVAVILALLYAIALTSIGLKFGLLIGFMTGILGIIPYFGHALGFCAALSVYALHPSGAFTLVGILVVFAVLALIDSYFITPKTIGHKVGLNAFTTLLALIVFGEFFGFVGIVIAIPITKLLSLYYERFLSAYSKSAFYRGEEKL